MKGARWHGPILLLVCFTMFWWRLGSLGLIDPDEPFYAQTTREMVQTNDWITPQIFGAPQFEKPILFYWQTMLAQKIFGDTEFAARFPSALFATLLVFGTWIFGRRLLSPGAGFYAALTLGTGIEFALMGRLMLTDISLAFFILVSFGAFWMALQDEKNRQWWVFLQLVASGLASLTKGPIGILFPVLGCGSYLLLVRYTDWQTHFKPRSQDLTGSSALPAGPPRAPWSGPGFWLGVVAWVAIAVPWYVIMFMKYGWEYWNAFAIHENWERLVVAEHPSNNHFWYYPMILVLGFLPWMPLLIAAVVRACRETLRHPTVLFLVCWFLPNLIFLTLAQSKLPSYIFFLFVPLALLMGRTLDAWLREGFAGRGEFITVSVIAIIQAVGLLAAPFIRPEAARYEWLAMVVAAPMCLTAVCFVLKQLRLAAAATVVAAAFIVIVALAWVAPDIESKVSTRSIASQIRELRRPGEPLITAAFLARAVTYYGGEKPTAVESYGKQPFFTKHPLPFVRGDKGLAEFLKDKPSVFFVGQLRDYKALTSQKSVLRDRCETLATVGEGDDARVILRFKGGAALSSNH